MVAKMASRQCASCGAVLARDNTASLCSPCRRVRHAAAPAPPEMPAEFWRSPEINEAASRRDMGALLYAYRSHATARRAQRRSVVAGQHRAAAGALS
jgi:uncharacterized Zn finger protein (UPF0148 family)